MSAGNLDLDLIRRTVAELLNVEPEVVGDDDPLIELGMDSVKLMRLVGRWQRGGVPVTFRELIERRTIGGWWELLAGRRPEEVAPPATEPVVEPGAPFSLTGVQQAYWIGRGDEQPLGGVGCHAYMEFDTSSIDPVRLETAVRRLTERHGMLRAVFLPGGYQQILPESRWQGLTVHDLRELGPQRTAARLEQVRDRLSHRRLAVESGQVFDVQLALLPGAACRLYVSIDLLVADVLSLQVFLRDLARYHADPGATPAPIDYSLPRYLAEQQALPAATREQAEEYWRRRVAGLPSGPRLPLAVDPDTVRRPRFTRREFRLSPADLDRLRRHAIRHDVTLASVLATAYAEVLGAWSEQPRFLLNVPLFDRQDTHPSIPDMIADFTSLVLLEIDTGSEESFSERVRGVQSQLHQDLAHAGYSGVEVLREMARVDSGQARTAPVVFASNLGDDFLGPEFRAEFGDLSWMISQTPQVWLDHQIYPMAGGLLLNWDAVEQLFPPGVLDAMFDVYRRVIHWLCDGDWSAPAPVALPEAQRTVRATVNTTAAPESEALLHEGFFAMAKSDPGRTALLFGDTGRMSYGELARRALSVAGRLRRHGLTGRDPVVVTLPKGPDQITAVLGVLAAGGHYVPIGVDQPPARRDRIRGRAGARLVLTSEAGRAGTTWPAGVEVLTVDQTMTEEPLAGPVSVPRTDPAYVIFTSGSTGEPKGVQISHRAAVNTVTDINERNQVGPADRVLAVSALDFDLSVYDIFGLLTAGGALVLVEEENRREARRWHELVERHGVSVWNSVPALLDMLLVAATGRELPGLRLVLLSGDWIGLDLPGRLAAQTGGRGRLIAMGGATEAAIWSNAYEVGEVPSRWRSIPYGFPLRNQRYRVVDTQGRDRPDWVAGELWIGGTGVADGYRGDPGLTAARFVEYQGDRWYRTGDLGRYWPDGTLEFLGRADHQVKIGGHRIELGEVETALAAHPEVRHAVVVVVGQRAKRLAAAVVPRGGAAGGPAGLVDWLADRLPGYMIPDTVLTLDELPLSGNGKVDRSAVGQLLAGAGEQRPDASGPLDGPVEKELAGLWAELLGVPGVGRDEDFFRLGGNSLLATRLVDGIGRRFGIRVSLRELFGSPTVGLLATLLERQLAELETQGLEDGEL
ncbi:amino acid adenylation domain-containing protein [Amycolatopsis sp. NPDC058986]|uniref:non-ribosomal peptide synthetase n=1 Tax=unclassified Amycolatopsis TaxID=2618356 RepID=UPI003671999F